MKYLRIYTTLILFASFTSLTMAQNEITICDGDSVLLNAGQNYNGSIQWQHSTNGVFFSPILGATTDPYKLIVTNQRYYRASINDSICDPFFSDTFYIMLPSWDTLEQVGSAALSGNTITGLDSSGNAFHLQLSGSIQYGTGSNGAYNSTGSTNLAGGVYNYTSFKINAGHTITVTGNNPLTIFCQGKVEINGSLIMNGSNGGNGDNNSAPGVGGAGCCGGSAGGTGGTGVTSTSSTYHGFDGLGPGGGKGGITEYVTSLDGQGGGGGSYGTAGTNSNHAGGGGGVAGPIYGSAQFVNVIGGSGGGGGAGDDDGGAGSSDGGGGGGGGGGALKISARNVQLASTGVIQARGGNGGSCGNGGSGGGGSGGAIFFEADTVNLQGNISAIGGSSITAQLAGSIGGTGGMGRVRMNYSNSYTNNATVTPAVGYVGNPIGVFNTSGTIETGVQTVTDLCEWKELEYYVDTSVAGTSVIVDVLSSTGSTLASNVASGTDLSTIPALQGVNQIKLKFTLSTTNTAFTPLVDGWRLLYRYK